MKLHYVFLAFVGLFLVSCQDMMRPQSHQKKVPTNPVPPMKQPVKKKIVEDTALGQELTEATTTSPEEKLPLTTDEPTTTSHTEITKPKVEKKDFPFGSKVPGKDGFVLSPYNNKVVDVRDMPSGTLVQDPTYPASEKKYFRVP